MAKTAALLEYSFLFDPTETWNHISQFESDLSDFFATLGLEAEVIASINGQPGRRLLLLRKVKKVGSITPSGTKASILDKARK